MQKNKKRFSVRVILLLCAAALLITAGINSLAALRPDPQALGICVVDQLLGSGRGRIEKALQPLAGRPVRLYEFNSGTLQNEGSTYGYSAAAALARNTGNLSSLAIVPFWFFTQLAAEGLLAPLALTGQRALLVEGVAYGLDVSNYDFSGQADVFLFTTAEHRPVLCRFFSAPHPAQADAILYRIAAGK